MRRDGQYPTAHAGGRAHVASHAAVAPHAASPLFAADRGADAREVFRGEVALPDARRRSRTATRSAGRRRTPLWPSGGDLLGARLASQWLAYPNPIHPVQLSVTNGLTMQVASSVPNLAGAIVRTGPVGEPAPLPDFGDVLPNTVPVICLRAP